MTGLVRNFVAAGAALIFAAVELLSPVPEFHRHTNELGLAQAAGPAGFVRDLPSRDSGSRDCPACAISGMSALAVLAATSLERPARKVDALTERTADPAVLFAPAFDGRAPPLT